MSVCPVELLSLLLADKVIVSFGKSHSDKSFSKPNLKRVSPVTKFFAKAANVFNASLDPFVNGAGAP